MAEATADLPVARGRVMATKAFRGVVERHFVGVDQPLDEGGDVAAGQAQLVMAGFQHAVAFKSVPAPKLLPKYR